MKLLVVLLTAMSITALGAGSSVNLMDIHRNAKANAAKCKTCHSQVLKQESSNPRIKAFHPLHLESPLLKLQCADCHASVDLQEKSGAKLRKQANPEFCNSCHGPWSAKMSKDLQKTDCTTCHADWKKKMAKATYVNLDKVTAKDCLGCHGGRALYSGSVEKKGV